MEVAVSCVSSESPATSSANSHSLLSVPAAALIGVELISGAAAPGQWQTPSLPLSWERSKAAVPVGSLCLL